MAPCSIRHRTRGRLGDFLKSLSDRAGVDLRHFDLESQVEFTVDWHKCQSEDEKQVIIDLLQLHQPKRVS